MWTENAVFREDLEKLADLRCIPWDALTDKRVFVTGGTGLIGYTLVSALCYYAKTRNVSIPVLVLARDVKKAQEKYAGQIADGAALTFVQGTVEALPEVEGDVDYIIHCAAPTGSAFFAERPVETITAVVQGTKNVLELAREKRVLGVSYLSSMEVYGEVTGETARGERDLGYVELYAARSSYPAGKRLAENLCCAYGSEYGVPVTTVRLAQTFGPGVEWEDGRVFAYAARCALLGEDIRLKTSGTKKNMYLYTADAVSAILLTLVRGERNTAYNAGNPATYCSVKEMVSVAARELGNGAVSVLTNTDQAGAAFYRPEGCLKLDVQRLEALGWRPETALSEMFRRMQAGFQRKTGGREAI